MKQMMMMIN